MSGGGDTASNWGHARNRRCCLTRTRFLSIVFHMDNNLTVDQSRDHKTTHIVLRVSPLLKQLCESAARKTGLTMADWARAVLARAANEGAFAPRRGGPHERKRRSKSKS